MMPTYAELLLSPEWRNKRLTILGRDNLCCQSCLNSQLLTNLSIAQGLLLNDETNDNLQYLLFGINKNPTQNRIYCFLRKEKTIWQNNFVRNHLLIYYDDIENNIAQPIAAREMVKQEIIYHDNLPVVFNPIKNPTNTNWIYNNTLHVHHKYYQIGLLPWQYNEEALMTLCWVCHERLHKNIKVPVRDTKGNEIMFYTPCNRCYGAGEFPEYKHVANGICFECWGAKYYECMVET